MSVSKDKTKSTDLGVAQGYEKAIGLLKSCLKPHGFVASPTERDNYNRIWSRDGCIMGVAALLSGDVELIDGFRRTLETLARNQGPHGEIPSNVDPATQRVSYGGSAGRVDGNLWFLIGCGRYWETTGDATFLRRMLEPIEKVRFLLGAWEYNNRGLLYVPLTGDWADEYVHTGYVLYDQLLYLQAQRELCGIHRHLHRSADHDLEDRMARLKHLIRDNYWFEEDGEVPEYVYHDVLYKKGVDAAPRCRNLHWMSFFTPAGYGYRFDTLSNVLVSLMNVAGPEKAENVDRYIAEHIAQDDLMVLPAFHPVITPKDEDWEELQMTFSYTFKNKPYEYHNGGLWPMVTGFYVADLAARGKTDLARRYLADIHKANAAPMKGEPWSFPEYLHGKTHKPEGTQYCGWSAAAAVIGEAALEGKSVFPAHSQCI